MVEPLKPPKRKNPLKRTQQQTLPPAARSRSAQLLTQAAAEGRFALQRCAECHDYVYPPREVCPNCLSVDLSLTEAPDGGVIVTETTTHVTSDSYFRERMPWRVGMVKLDCGPIAVAHLHGDCQDGDRVRATLQLDKSGQAVFFAIPSEPTPNMDQDRQWYEMVAKPQFRRVLVTNGRSAIGQAVASALAETGATVYVGIAEPWKPFPGEERLRGGDFRIVPLDAPDERSVRELAADIGGKIDILVNTSEFIRPGGLLDRSRVTVIRDEMEQLYLGFVNLAQAFGPAMMGRGADQINSAAAWVNIFSVHALANWSAFGTHSAAEAACLSLSHCLRGELRGGGVRVVNLFTGPTDTEWFQALPPPKVAPRALASAVVTALNDGIEEMFVGDVAKEIRQNLADNPKSVEREFTNRLT